MVVSAKEVGPNRYRESAGRYFEDFVAGDVYEHRPGRTITESDNTWFTLLTMNTHPLHFDAEYAKASEFGKRVVHRRWFTLLTMNTHPLHFDAEYAKASEFGKRVVSSPLTLAIVVGQSVADVSAKAIANLGWGDIKMPAPVFIGDTLYSESEVLGKRESKSRPTQGIVTVKTVGRNQDRAEVISFERTVLMAKRGHAVDDVSEHY